jgi:hypothetical protein
MGRTSQHLSPTPPLIISLPGEIAEASLPELVRVIITDYFSRRGARIVRYCIDSGSGAESFWPSEVNTPLVNDKS